MNKALLRNVSKFLEWVGKSNYSKKGMFGVRGERKNKL